jgi:hypothetical protein
MNLRIALLVVAALLCGCAMTKDVNRRKAGEKWYYYGPLLDLYQDQTGGSAVALVWIEQVQTQTVASGKFNETIRELAKQGYRKIGFLSVRSVYPFPEVDPNLINRLAADKGAQRVVATSHPIRSVRGAEPIITDVRRGKLGQPEYNFGMKGSAWTDTAYQFQFMGKANDLGGTPTAQPIPTTPTIPTVPTMPSYPGTEDRY